VEFVESAGIKLVKSTPNILKGEGMMKKKNMKRFCSKHQVFHGEQTIYRSCCFPNEKGLKKEPHANPDKNAERDTGRTY